MFDIYERAVGGNSIFLLNIPPNREGRFADTDVEVLKEAGRRIQETYGTDLLENASGPKEVLDSDENTFVQLSENTGELIIETPHPITFNRILLQEAIATHSERVEKHAIDAWVDGQWKQIAQSTNIGYKRILRFQDVTTSRIRVRIIDARLAPAICRISAHYYQKRPPVLVAQRSMNGMVTLTAAESDFSWSNWNNRDNSKRKNRRK